MVAAPLAAPSTFSIEFERTDEDFFCGRRRSTPTELTPTAAEVGDYVYDATKYDLALKAALTGEDLFLIGVTGCGKTAFAKWLAHELRLSLYFVPHDAQTENEDLLAKPEQGNDGIWRHKLGSLPLAYGQGGVYLADELPSVKPGVAKVYNPVTNGDRLLVRTAAGIHTIKRHPDFIFIATGNPWTTYAGNNVIAFDLMDRCATFEWDFPSREVEVGLLSTQFPDIGLGIIEDLVAFADQIRRSAAQNPDNHRYVCSTRAPSPPERRKHS